MYRVIPGDNILYVGNGSSLAILSKAQEFGCQMMGLGLMEAMVKAAQGWSAIEGPRHKVQFAVGHAMSMPFEENSFDIVSCESVHTFLPVVEAAMMEYARATNPGGIVARNEAVWYRSPNPQAESMMHERTRQQLRREREWVEPLTAPGRDEIQARTYPVAMAAEMRALN